MPNSAGTTPINYSEIWSTLPVQESWIEQAAAEAWQIAQAEIDQSGIDSDSDPARWIAQNFYIPETHGAITLAPYQIACLREALRRDENGQYKYSLVVWSDIKKSAKSSIAAAVGLWVAYNVEWASIKVIANDLKQADSRVSYYMRRAITLNQVMKSSATVNTSGYSIKVPGQHSMIEAVPIDPKGEAGGNDDAVIYSELWGANSKAAQQLWTETTLSPTKYGQSFRWVETYAGYTGQSPILENLYEQGVNKGRRIDLSFDGHDLSDLEVYVNDAARLFCLWNTKPRLAWQSPEYYAQEAAVLLPSEFERVHRNQWVSSQDTFVPLEWWDACGGDVKPLDRDDPIVIGLDAAVSNDSFAVIAVSRDDDLVSVRYARRWLPPHGGEIDFNEPEAEIRRLCDEYNVVEIDYDPYQLHSTASRLRQELNVRFKPFSQAGDRLIADKQLYDLIRDRRIVHSREPELREHITNADAAKDGDKLRIVKRADHLKIDLAVALSMASARALKVL